MKPNLRVLFLAAEADPFVKVGGLGDVAGSLPGAIKSVKSLPSDSPYKEIDIDIRVVIPLHNVIRKKNLPIEKLVNISIPFRGGWANAEIWTLEHWDVPVYFVSGSLVPSDGPVYSSDLYLDGLKYTFVSLAALEFVKYIDWKPDIIHANDWHTSASIYATNIRRDTDDFFNATSTLLGVHNLPYLGSGAGPALGAFGLPPAWNSPLPWWAQDLPLPMGLLASDHIVVVSPTYAKEILTAEFGNGLDNYLKTKAKNISGILNGINVDMWNPVTDRELRENYEATSLDKRLANKEALQSEMNLAIDPDIPLIGVISRFEYQKGIDLVPEAIHQIASTLEYAAQKWQLVVLGSGDPSLESAMRRLTSELPQHVRTEIRYDSALSHRIYAGADIMLIPSRYEPCGLTQMIAMRYGCIPIGRATGGLRDTIQDYEQSLDSTGFLFTNASSEELAWALGRALQFYSNRIEWSALQRRAMGRDFSWNKSAQEYLTLYLSLVEKRKKEVIK